MAIIPRGCGARNSASFNCRSSNVWVVRHAQVESIGSELYLIADKSANRRIVVDLQNVELMSSALIGVFIRFKMRVRKNGSELKLCNASDDLLKLLKATKLDRVFDIHKTRRAAVEAI